RYAAGYAVPRRLRGSGQRSDRRDRRRFPRRDAGGAGSADQRHGSARAIHFRSSRVKRVAEPNMPAFRFGDWQGTYDAPSSGGGIVLKNITHAGWGFATDIRAVRIWLRSEPFLGPPTPAAKVRSLVLGSSDLPFIDGPRVNTTPILPPGEF